MQYLYQNPDLPVSERVKDLLSRMSVDEKIGQLCKLDGFRSYDRVGGRIVLKQEFKDTFAAVPIGSMYGLLRADWWTGKDWEIGIDPEIMAESIDLFQRFVVENSRWGIPLLMAEEAPHGLMALGGTVFPTGLGLGATWNPERMRSIAEVINAEGAAAGVHTVYGPVLDVPRDPRWSRNEEDFSEDPYLTSRMGVSYVQGLQHGTFPEAGCLFATLKHLAGHGDPEGGHNAAPGHMGPIEFRNIHFKPFEACIKAGARSMMCAYHTIDGVPCAGNHDLLTRLVRDECGFDGFIVSDRGAIPHLYQHRFAGSETEACAMALKAGLDTDEGFIDFHSKGLREAFKLGLIEMTDLDLAVGRVLKLKFSLGLFENPYRRSGEPIAVLGSQEHRQVALESARESLILLSNNGVLPLTDVNSLAVVGPNADVPMNQLGDYTAPQRPDDVITVRNGLEALGIDHSIKINYAKGCGVRSLKRDGLAQAVDALDKSDACVLCLGGSSAWGREVQTLNTGAAQIEAARKNPEIDKESGEGYDRASLRLAGLQLELLKELKATGKPVVVVLIMGRPMIINEVLDLADAVLLAWYPGMMGGQAIAEALFGETNPGGRLPVSLPRDEGQLPVFYNTHLPRRDYIDLDGNPRLQFGFGLSYTAFAYSDLKLSAACMAAADDVLVCVNVTNTGGMDGDEVVQVYLTDQAASVARPYRELCAFQRIHLKAGECRTLDFKIGKNELGFYNRNLEHVVEPGKFTIAIGGSLDGLLETELEVTA